MMSHQRKLDRVLQELEEVYSSPSIRLAEKIGNLLKEGKSVLLFDPDGLVTDVHSIRGRLAKVKVEIVKGDLEFRNIFYSLSREEAPVVIIDQSPHGVFFPDVLAQKSMSFLGVDVRSFLEEETGREWPPEVRNFPFKEVVRKRWKDFLEIYNFVQGRQKLSLSHKALRRLAASAVLRTNLFITPSVMTAWELVTQRDEEWAELREFFDEKEVEEIRAELQVRELLVSQLFDPKQCETARKALACCLLLRQYLQNPQEMLPLLDPSFHPYFNFNPEGLQVNGEIPYWVLEEVEGFEKSLSVQAWDILSRKLNMEDMVTVKKILEIERFSLKLGKLALLKAVEFALENKDASSLLRSAEIRMGLGDEDFEKRKVFLGSVTEAYTIFDALTSDLKTLMQKEPSTMAWREICETYVERSVYKLERLLWKVDQQSRALRIGDETNPSWVKTSIEKIKQSIKDFLKDGLEALDKFDRLFQGFVQYNYPLLKPEEAVSTPQFIEGFLLPRMRASDREGVIQVLLFDGMRFDLWREVVRPILEERYILVDENPALAMLPSATRFSRKACFAGRRQFKDNVSEIKLLSEALTANRIITQIIQHKVPSKVVSHALKTEDDRLNWTIVNLTDNLPHHLPYNLDSIFGIVEGLKEEVLTVFSNVPLNAEILVLSDHGFSQIGDEPIHIEGEDVSMHYAFVNKLPADKECEKIIVFEREQLGFSGKGYVIFPKTGYYFLKNGVDQTRYTYCHGGASFGEMVIPFARLIPKKEAKPRIVIEAKIEDRYKEKEEGDITLILTLKGIFEEEIDLNSNIPRFKPRKVYLRRDLEKSIDVSFVPSKPGRQTLIFEAKKEGQTLGKKTVRINVVETGRVERLGEEKIKKLFEGD